VDRLYDLIAKSEDQLVSKIIQYAREYSFTKYTSTLEEAWRIAIRGLSEPLLKALKDKSPILELSPDEDFTKDPVASFGILEAQRHRSRGITLSMFLGLMKYYRQSYIDLVRQADFEKAYEDYSTLFVQRFFDRMEIGFVAEWAETSRTKLLDELQSTNRVMTNEKNKYLTIFESTPGPVIFLDNMGRIENMNQAATDLIFGEGTPGHSYYGGKKKKSRLPWLHGEAKTFISSGKMELEFERELETQKGVRYFQVKLKRMLDVSQKFGGATVILYDLTERRLGEMQIEHFASFPQFNPEPIIEIDRNGTITYCNWATLKTLKKLHCDDDVSVFIPGDIKKIIEKLSLGKDRTLYREIQIKRRIFAERIYFTKQFGTVRIYATDITYRKQTEKDLQKTKNELEKRVEERTRQLFDVNDQLRKEIEVRKSVEMELTSERQRLFAVLDELPAYVYLHAPDCSVRFANRFFRQRFGNPEGRHPYEIFKGLTEPCDICSVQQVTQSKAPTEWEFTGPDGRIYHSYNYPFDDIDGTTMVLELGIDVTDRKATEEAIRLVNVYNRSLIEAGLDPLVTIDPAGKINDVNHATEIVTGRSREELIGTDFSDYFTDPERARHGYQLVFSQSSVRNYELEIQHKDGHVTPVLYNATLYKDNKGKTIGVFAAARDMTELKRVEEERARLAAAVEQSAEGVLITDRKGLAVYINRAFEEITGHVKADIIGCRPDIMTKESQSQWYSSIREALHHGNAWAGRIELKKKDGIVREVDLTVSPVKDASGAIINYVSVGRDVTGQVKLEKELRQAQKMEAIGTLAGGIAHDFNNILAGIIGFTEMSLEDASDSGPSRENLEFVLKGAHRGRDLVRQILTFSRKSEPEKKPTNLRTAIEEVLPILRASIPSTVEIREHIKDSSKLVLADRIQIHQILMNLCSNAAHSMNAMGGILEIDLDEIEVVSGEQGDYPDLLPDRYMRLAVSDTGHGMDRFTLERIFEPFFTTKNPGEGTGMGLSVVHGIVKSHNGEITVKSEINKGSIVEIYFPVLPERALIREPMIQRLSHGKERILFVDDEADIVAISKDRLQRLGYDVVALTNSLDALETFCSNPDSFDLVITDYTMPHLTGIDLANKIRRMGSTIPIILCSGNNESVTEMKIKEAGIIDLATKPLNKKEFSQLVRKALDRGR
jgi:PAS domain S-box-containing protein